MQDEFDSKSSNLKRDLERKLEQQKRKERDEQDRLLSEFEVKEARRYED